ncbi:MAG: DUF2520 domain-containing protein [Chloroflexota bacterium]|nr:DUF2520 domain-containing protein [Chloroflexota bacterium]
MDRHATEMATSPESARTFVGNWEGILPTVRPTLGFVGAGRAGSALAHAFARAGYHVAAVYSRTPEHTRWLATALGAEACHSPVDVARRVEVLFLTVPDDQIAAVARELELAPLPNPPLVAHCSGALDRSVLSELRAAGFRTAGFHPLQSLTGASSAERLSGSCVGIEADEREASILTSLARDLGAVPLLVPADRKLPYHVAAVLASNYLVALLDSAVSLLSEVGCSRDLAMDALLPLVEGTVANLRSAPPAQALTGPIARGDLSTVAAHMSYLREAHPELVELYRALGLRTVETARSRSETASMRELLAL